MEINEFGYFSKAVADQLGTKSDTLRSWARALEQHGIDFDKNEKEQRIYSDKDVRAFTEMKRLLETGHPLFKVGRHVAEEIEKGTFDRLSTDNHASITHSVIGSNHAPIMLQSRQEELEDFKAEIISGVLEGLKGQVAAPNHSETLHSILNSVQELQKSTSKALELPSGENPSEKKLDTLDINFKRLVDAHTHLLADFEAIRNRNLHLEKENARLEKELAEKPKKRGWLPWKA